MVCFLTDEMPFWASPQCPFPGNIEGVSTMTNSGVPVLPLSLPSFMIDQFIIPSLLSLNWETESGDDQNVSTIVALGSLTSGFTNASLSMWLTYTLRPRVGTATGFSCGQLCLENLLSWGAGNMCLLQIGCLRRQRMQRGSAVPTQLLFPNY